MTAPPTKGKGRTFQWVKARVAYEGEDCLKWPFSTDRNCGRGRLGHMGKGLWAHRLMCELAHGPQPSPDHECAHSCGKGHEGCVNPRHLSWKTVSENGRDRLEHGTAVTTRAGYRGKLTPEAVAEIRAQKGKKTQLALAAEFNVSPRTIQYWHGMREQRGHGFGEPCSFDGNTRRRRLEKLAAKITSIRP